MNHSATSRSHDASIGPILMIISAAIFGYFGFRAQFVHTSSITGAVLPFVVIYEYTLKGAAIAFVFCAGITFALPRLGSLLYAVAGLLAGLGLGVAGILDYLDKQHTVQDPFLTLLFAFIILIIAGASLRDWIRSGAAVSEPPDTGNNQV